MHILTSATKISRVQSEKQVEKIISHLTKQFSKRIAGSFHGFLW